jgi:hypothetical protein
MCIFVWIAKYVVGNIGGLLVYSGCSRRLFFSPLFRIYECIFSMGTLVYD